MKLIPLTQLLRNFRIRKSRCRRFTRLKHNKNMKIKTLLVMLGLFLPAAMASNPYPIKIAWNASNGADYYSVYQAVGVGPYYKTQKVYGTSTVVFVTSPATYYFYITASNSAGESGPSNLVSKRVSKKNLR